MADDFTPPSSDSASAAPAEPASSSPSSDSAGSAASDTRSIAAELLRDTDAGDTAAASPAAPPSRDSQPPAAATSDEAAEAEYQSLLASGAVPTDRHKAVVTNTRNKTRAEVEAEFRAKYGWVDELQLDRARADHATGLMRALEANPEHTLRTLAHAMGIELAPKAVPEPDGPPPPDVKLDDGSEFYSAKQLAALNKWQEAQFEKRLASFAERYDPLVRRQVETDMRLHAQTEAGTLLQTCRQEWPQFQALEGDIKQRMTADPTLSLERAYIASFAAKGLPALEAQHATDRASQLQRKAAASSAPPSAPRSVTPLRDRDRSTRDIVAEELARVSA